jgi:oxygen-independent coproporphyrinogen-3 oxidase
MKPPSSALYFHWPFCLSKCPYCDFNSHVREKHDEDIWLESFLKSIEYEFRKHPHLHISSIFFGGGTPSLMSPELVRKILEKVKSCWNLPEEITLEANPNSIETDKFKAFKEAGITRVSIGIQSLNDDDLKFLGRTHSSLEALRALDIGKKVFENWSFDLIYARPNQTLKTWEEELKRALDLNPKHISLYQLTIEPGTAFHTLHQRKAFIIPGDDLAADLYELTREITQSYGFNDYEISNYAKPGYESAHNLNYWRYGDYLGIGPGAHGRITAENSQKCATKQFKAPETWLKAVENNDHGYESIDILEIQDIIMEKILMGIRLTEGVNIENAHFSPNDLTKLVENELALIDNAILKLTPLGRLKTNAVLEYLFHRC